MLRRAVCGQGQAVHVPRWGVLEREGAEGREAMNIPKRFKLFGATIEVVENPKLQRERNWCGSSDYEQHRIELVPISDSYEASRAKFEQTFCHELAHFLCYGAGGVINHKLDGYLHQDEEFVDLLGSLLHQAITTMEYE